VSVDATGVVVLSYGAGAEHEGLLASLAGAGVRPTSIVLVHNPSAPGQPPPSVPGECELIQAGHNLGYAGGMNLGIERQLDRGVELILLVTHDARLRPDALAALVEAARSLPEYGVFGPALVLAGTQEPFSFGGRTRSNGSMTHIRERPDQVENGVFPCDWIDGGTMLVRAAVINRVGGFDERFWSYCEEADLCLRATRGGFGVGVVAAAVAEQAPGGAKRLGAWSYLLNRNGIAYAGRAAGLRGVLFTSTRASSIAGISLLRAGARAAGIRRGDPAVPWIEAAGTIRGVVDFFRRRWGPPPSLPGTSDIANTRPLQESARRRAPRILHLSPDPEIGGGMATAMRALLRSPLADGYELDVVATYRNAEPFGRLAIYGLAVLRLVWWRLRRRGEIVHVHAAVRGSMYRKAVLVLLAKALRSRVVLQVHAGPGDVEAFASKAGRPALALFEAAFRAADVSVAVSQATASAVERAYGASGVLVVPNSAPRLTTVAHREGAGGAAALYLGGFADPAKGGGDLLTAVEAALASAPELHVTIAGPGELPQRGRELVADRPEGCQWSGWLTEAEKDTALAEADVFILASVSEGLPMALLEAMAGGLAIVATEVGGVPEVLETERDALLVPAGDPGALGQALVRLAHDSELRARLGESARQRADELGADGVAARLDAIYSGLLGG